MKINGLRFIVGSGCNYDCFYCHHEGYKSDCKNKIDDVKLEKIYQYAEMTGVNSISITGGEPFLYWENTYKILQKFNDEKYRITLNSNFSLADTCIEDLKKLNPIEFHINLSSIYKSTHERVINRVYLERVMKNLELIKETGHIICLNILAIKGINEKELMDIFNYANANAFKPRILVLMAMNEEQKQYVMNIDDILKLFTNPKIGEKYAHGLYKVSSEEGNFEILKTICDDLECDICAKNTFMHLTPDLSIKYCLRQDDIVPINYESLQTIDESFCEAQKRLEKRIR